MSKVVFVYENHADQSAALVLQQLLQQLSQTGAGNVTLCLETPPGDVLSDMAQCGVQIARNLGSIEIALNQKDPSVQVKSCNEILKMEWMRLPSEQSCKEINGTQLLRTFLHEGQGISNCIKATLQLIRIAKQNDVKVLGIDLPFEKRSGDGANDVVRQQCMYNKLVELSQKQDSVTIYLVGLSHADVATALRNKGVTVLEYFVHDFLPNTFSEEFPGIGEECVEMSIGIAGGELSQEQIRDFASTMRDNITQCRAVGEKPVALSLDAEAQAHAAEKKDNSLEDAWEQAQADAAEQAQADAAEQAQADAAEQAQADAAEQVGAGAVEQVGADAADGDTPPHALPNEHGAMVPLVEAGAPGGDYIGSTIITASLDAAQGAPALLGLGTNCGSGVSVD